VAIAATILQVTPEGKRALVDAQLREMDSRRLALTFTVACASYQLALRTGRQPSLVDVMQAAVNDTAPL
jgi:hypothetical protein